MLQDYEPNRPAAEKIGKIRERLVAHGRLLARLNGATEWRVTSRE
jgi:hypothetical protein